MNGVSFGMFELAVLARAAVLVWCLVAWIRRQPEPAPAHLPVRVATAETDPSAA